MPEDNFEQQARRKAEEFGMEPKPEVWLRVHKAIAPQERKRRLLLWWWLLPFCVAGIVALRLTGGKTESTEDKTAAVVHKKERKPQPALDSLPAGIEEKESWASQYKTKEEKGVAESRAGLILQNRPIGNVLRERLLLMEKKEETAESGWHEPVSSERGRVEVTEKNERAAITENEFATGDSVKYNLLPEKIDSLQKEETGFLGMKVSEIKDSASNKPGIPKTVVQKEDNKKKWQIGILTELGLTSWGKDFFTKELEADTTSKYFQTANASMLDSFIANTSEIRQTKNGVDAAIGFVVRKTLGKHFYFNGQLGYRYQQYTLYNLRQSDPVPATESSRSSIYLINKNNYRHHFLNLSVKAGRSVYTGRRVGLSAEAGFDNSLLLTMKQQQNKNVSADFNTNNRLATADFFRWQPSVVISFPVGLYSKSQVRFQLSPFARLGIRTFEKNGGGYSSNHLISAGLQASYFFK